MHRWIKHRGLSQQVFIPPLTRCLVAKTVDEFSLRNSYSIHNIKIISQFWSDMCKVTYCRGVSVQTLQRAGAYQWHRNKSCPAYWSSCPNECWRRLPGVRPLSCLPAPTSTPASLGLKFIFLIPANESVLEARAGGGTAKHIKARRKQPPFLSDNDKHNEDPLRFSLSFPHYEDSSAHHAWHSHPFTRGNWKKNNRYTNTRLPYLDP